MTTATNNATSILSRQSSPSRDLTTLSRWRHPFINLVVKRLNAVSVDTIQIELNDGTLVTAGSDNENTPIPRVTLKRARAIVRGCRDGLMGWAEGYMADDWDVDDVRALTQWAMANEARIESAFDPGVGSVWLNRLWHKLNDNTLRGSRKNIQYHYDLGNDFYRLWLDRTMTYSSALFKDKHESLEQAQRNKYQRIIELLDPQTDDKVLEIGCGWGGFAAELFAQCNVQYEGVTLSDEQLEWSRHLHVNEDRARFSLTDYRDIEYRADRTVSIEMFEAVGEKHWPTFFNQLKATLRPGGTAVLQVITIDEQRFNYYKQTPDFIQKYIFPGGMLPSPERFRASAHRAGLELVHEESFGQDYAKTLKLWHEAFLEHWDTIAKQGFDQRFYRMWRYYLAYCEAGFNAQAIDVRLFKLVNN